MKKLLLPVFLIITTLVGAQDIVINEVDADNPSTDTQEFIELLTSSPNMSLDGYVIVLYNGSDNQSYEAFDLDGYSSDENGFFVLGTSEVSPEPDYVFSKADNVIQNGADAVALFQDDASNFPNDTPITTDNLIDVIVYGTSDDDDPELLSGFGETIQWDEGANGDQTHHSNQRKSDGTYEAKTPTPGAANDQATSSDNILYLNDGISFYPNPVINELKFEGNIKGVISILNAEGSMLIRREINGNSVDLSNLNAGVYLYNIKAEDKILSGKFIKQ